MLIKGAIVRHLEGVNNVLKGAVTVRLFLTESISFRRTGDGTSRWATSFTEL